MKNKKLTVFDAGIAFLLGFVFASLTSSVGVTIAEALMQSFGKTAAQIEAFWNTATGYLLQVIFMNLGFILVFAMYFKRINAKSLISKPSEASRKYMLQCILLGVITMFLLSGVLQYFQYFVEKSGYHDKTSLYSIDSVGKYLISLVSLAAIPAICEELLFRGLILNALKSKGKIFAVIVSSLMFCIFHLNPLQLIYPICFGLILGIVYIRTNNLLYPILLHFVNNALSVSIQYFGGVSSSPFVPNLATALYAILTFIVWVSLMRILFKDFKKNCAPDNESAVAKLDATSENTREASINNIVLYGSVGIMLIIYVISLF